MAALRLDIFGGGVPGASGVDGCGVPRGLGVEVLEDVPLREFEGSIEGFEGGVRHCIFSGLAGPGLGLGLALAALAALVSSCFGEGVSLSTLALTSVASHVAHSVSEFIDSAQEGTLVVGWRPGISNWDSLGSCMSSLVAPTRAILIETSRPCPCSL